MMYKNQIGEGDDDGDGVNDGNIHYLYRNGDGYYFGYGNTFGNGFGSGHANGYGGGDGYGIENPYCTRLLNGDDILFIACQQVMLS